MSRKIANLIKIVTSLTLAKDLRIEPILLELDVTNHCNLCCVMCPNKKMLREKGFMDLALFKQVVDQTVSSVWEYSIGIHGEPTLCPNLADMIGYIKAKGGKVALNTNLNYRNEVINEYLVRNSVNRIIVNMCSTDKETYEKISLNGDYNLVIHNLLKIKEIKKRLGRDKPVLVGYFTKMKMNFHQTDSVKRKFQKYFDYSNIATMHDWAGDNEIGRLKPDKEIQNRSNKCSMPWTTATILWDGRIAACCQDYEGKIILGDVKTMNLEQIWNSPEIKQFRKKHFDSILCKSCSDGGRFQLFAKNTYYTLKTTL